MPVRMLTVAFVFALVAGLGVLGLPGKGFCQQSEAKTYNGVPYISGGVGITSRTDLQQAAKGYNLKVVMAMRNGDYLADAEVTVENHAGQTVLDVESQGPWLYAKLPAGKYKVIGNLNGQKEEKFVEIVPHKLSLVRLYW